ncbi:MAG: hypothetical protein WBB76_11800 [Gaiellaceae bacterium]
MNREPGFDELVGEDLPNEERARLERVHELLLAAGPPPELPPALADPAAASHEAPTIILPRRRAGAVLALAAAIALVAFVGGFVAGRTGGTSFSKVRSLQMHGTGVSRSASATIDIGRLDASGNWPLRVVVRSLPRLPQGGYYEMFLTRNGKPAASCGTFAANGGTSTVRLTAPYDLRSFDGWVVTRDLPKTRTQPVVLTT